MVRFGILGSIELYDDGRRVPVGGPRQVSLLAYLLLHANRAVSNDELVDAVWSERDPAGAVKRLQVAVARLRKTLDGPVRVADDRAALRWVGGGYLLAVGLGDLDAEVFATRVDEGRGALDSGEPGRASEILRGALAMWRGPALAEVAYEEFAQPEIRRLEELRLAALEVRVEADLQIGRHAAVIAELDALIAGHPTRERLAGQLMRALYHSGRQADALDVYRRTRSHLAAELGLEPGPALNDLQAAILQQSPALELAAHSARLPIASAARAAQRMPACANELLGRERDLRAVSDLLRQTAVRLVTVTGTGGVGKTSVALAIVHRLAAEFADGAAFVDLSALRDPAGVANAVLDALGAEPEPGVPVNETLHQLVAAGRHLLVLDNFERLLEATPLVVELLAGAPGLTLLITSRVTLDLAAEYRYPLEPLALPEMGDDVAAVTHAPATALFIRRATARDPTFGPSAANAAAIAKVCRRVSGLPLAIELAAARMRTLSAHEIARQLDPILPALGVGGPDAPERQRTLRATLDWSNELLDQPEREIFARVAIFAGGCTLDAAEQVTDASVEIIDGLIAKSMLTRRGSDDDQTRLGMLEPVREYAAELLATQPDADQIADRHSQHYVDLALAARPKLSGPDQLAWRRRLDTDADNLRQALAHNQRTGNAAGVLLIATALEAWWHDHALAREGRRWIEDALASARGDIPVTLAADALRVASFLSQEEGDLDNALDHARAALELAATRDDSQSTARCLAQLASCQSAAGDGASARRAAAEAVELARDADDSTLAQALETYAVTVRDVPTAMAAGREAAALYQRVGDVRGVGLVWGQAGWVALLAGALDEAEVLNERALRLHDQADAGVHAAYTYGNYALVALESGDHAVAAARFHETLARCQTCGLRRPVPEALIGVGAISARAGEHERARRLLEVAIGLRGSEPPSPFEQRLCAEIIERARACGYDHHQDHAGPGTPELKLEDALHLGLQTSLHLTRSSPDASP